MFVNNLLRRMTSRPLEGFCPQPRLRLAPAFACGSRLQLPPAAPACSSRPNPCLRLPPTTPVRNPCLRLPSAPLRLPAFAAFGSCSLPALASLFALSSRSLRPCLCVRDLKPGSTSAVRAPSPCNGKESGTPFFRYVCRQFVNPPPPAAATDAVAGAGNSRRRRLKPPRPTMRSIFGPGRLFPSVNRRAR